MMHRYSHLKTLIAILILTLGIFSFHSTASAQSTASTCNPDILQAMKDQGTAVAQRSAQIAQALITRPDPTAQMVCLGEQLMTAAYLIGSLFTDNPTFSGGCAVGGVPASTISAIASTMGNLVGLYNLGGGTLSVLYDTVANMLLAAGAGIISGLISGLITSVLGACFGGIVGGVVTSIITSLFPDPCDGMDIVWEQVALANVKPAYFQTLSELSFAPDPRSAIGNIPFALVAATGLFSAATANTSSSLAASGAFAPANLNLTTWAPLSVSGTCTTTVIFGQYISCNKGCSVVGTPPGPFTCVP